MSHIAHLVTVSQNQSHSSYWIFTRMSQTKDVFGDGTSSMSLAGRKPKEPTWRSDIISDTAIWLSLCQLLGCSFAFHIPTKLKDPKEELIMGGHLPKEAAYHFMWLVAMVSRYAVMSSIFFGLETNNCLSREPFNNIKCMLGVFVIPKCKKRVSKGRGSRQAGGRGGCEQNDPNWTRNEQNTVNWTPVQIWMNHAIGYLWREMSVASVCNFAGKDMC